MGIGRVFAPRGFVLGIFEVLNEIITAKGLKNDY